MFYYLVTAVGYEDIKPEIFTMTVRAKSIGEALQIYSEESSKDTYFKTFRILSIVFSGKDD